MWGLRVPGRRFRIKERLDQKQNFSEIALYISPATLRTARVNE
jgi:hypothetical protein